MSCPSFDLHDESAECRRLVGLGAPLAITASENPSVLAFGVPGWAAFLFLLPILVRRSTLGALPLTGRVRRSA